MAWELRVVQGVYRCSASLHAFKVYMLIATAFPPVKCLNAKESSQMSIYQ